MCSPLGLTVNPGNPWGDDPRGGVERLAALLDVVYRPAGDTLNETKLNCAPLAL